MPKLFVCPLATEMARAAMAGDAAAPAALADFLTERPAPAAWLADDEGRGFVPLWLWKHLSRAVDFKRSHADRRGAWLLWCFCADRGIFDMAYRAEERPAYNRARVLGEPAWGWLTPDARHLPKMAAFCREIGLGLLAAHFPARRGGRFLMAACPLPAVGLAVCRVE